MEKLNNRAFLGFNCSFGGGKVILRLPQPNFTLSLRNEYVRLQRLKHLGRTSCRLRPAKHLQSLLFGLEARRFSEKEKWVFRLDLVWWRPWGFCTPGCTFAVFTKTDASTYSHTFCSTSGFCAKISKRWLLSVCNRQKKHAFISCSTNLFIPNVSDLPICMNRMKRNNLK